MKYDKNPIIAYEDRTKWGVLTDTRGYLLSDDVAIVYFTVSVTGSDWL